jgi:hypothetical protein
MYIAAYFRRLYSLDFIVALFFKKKYFRRLYSLDFIFALFKVFWFLHAIKGLSGLHCVAYIGVAELDTTLN